MNLKHGWTDDDGGSRRWLAGVLVVGVLMGFGVAALSAGVLPVDVGMTAGTGSMGYGGEQAAVTVDPALVGGINHGDVVVFRDDGQLIHHRAIRETAQGWVTQGDVLDYPDQNPPVGKPAPHVTASSAVGVAVLTVPLAWIHGVLAGLAVVAIGAGFAWWRPDPRPVLVRASEFRRATRGSVWWARTSSALAVVLAVAVVLAAGPIQGAAESATSFQSNSTDNLGGSAAASESGDIYTRDFNGNLIKWNPDGTKAWDIAAGTDDNGEGYASFSNAANAVYIGSSSVVKIDPTGSQVASAGGGSGDGIYARDDNGRVYTGGSGQVIVYDENLNQIDTINVGSGTVRSVEYDEETGDIFVGISNTHVRRYTTGGSEVWSTSVSTSGDWSAITVSDTRVVVGDEREDGIHTFDKSDGSSAWTDVCGNAPPEQLRSTSNRIYVACNNAVGDGLFAYTESGTIDWSKEIGGGAEYGVAIDRSRSNLTVTGNTYEGTIEWFRTSTTTGSTVSGTATDTDGNGVSGATVTIYSGTTEGSGVAGTATTNATGDYSIDGIQDGDHLVTLTHPWYENRSKTVTISGGTSNLDFTALERLYRIEGTVTNTTGSPLEGVTVTYRENGTLRGTATTNATGQFSVKLPAGRDYTGTYEQAGYLTRTRSFVNNQNQTVSTTLEESLAPIVVAASPRGGVYRPDQTAVLSASIRDPNGDRFNASLFWYNQSGQWERVARVTNVSGTYTLPASVASRHGTNRWYVRMTDGVNTRTSSTFSYQAPGQIRVYYAQNLSKVESADVRVVSTVSDYVDTRTVSNGVVDLWGVPDESLLVRITKPGYSDQTLAIEDPTNSYYTLLAADPDGTQPGNDTTVEQGFELVDRDGDFPPSQSYLIVERYYLGDWRQVGSAYFGATNNATIALTEGELYRLTVGNGEGQQAVIGEVLYDPSNFAQPERLIVPEQPDAPGNASNTAPVARFSYQPTAPRTEDVLTFDATASGDDDGSITGYRWDFDGDGDTDATGARVTHRYRSGGNYTVTLTVTDDDGATDSVAKTFYVNASAEPPVARWSLNVSAPYDGIEVALNGSASSDPDRSISGYRWVIERPTLFNYTIDPGNATEVIELNEPGNWTISLTVQDLDGLTDTATRTINVAKNQSLANEIPTASISQNVSNPDAGQPVEFDGSGSSDPDGSITSYEWDFDDDGQFDDANGSTAVYRWVRNGTYQVSLRVTDDRGSQATTTTTVTVGAGEPTAPPNQPPTVSVSVSPSNPDPGQQVTLTANASDPDGNVTAIRWDVGGDGTVEDRGNTTRYTWETEGVYEVQVEVTDDFGTTNTTTVQVQVGDGDPNDGPPYRFDAVVEDRNESDQEMRIGVEWVARSGVDVSNLSIRIYEFGNRSNSLVNNSYGTATSVSFTQPLTGAQLNASWVVRWSATLDGEQLSGRVRLDPRGPTGLELPLAEQWLSAIALLTLTITAALFPQDLANLGAVVLVFVAGGMMLLKLLEIAVVSWWIALFIAGLGQLKAAQGRDPA